MTEAEWLTATDPAPMLEFLKAKASDRKFRLFAVASCRRVFHLMTDERTQAAVMVAEDYADGNVDDWARARAEAGAESVRVAADNRYDNRLRDPSYPDGDEGVARGWELIVHVDSAAAGRWALRPSAFAAADDARQAANSAEKGAVKTRLWAARQGREEASKEVWSESLPQTELLRCIFGNPFRTASLDPSWRTSTAVALAKQMYESRDFSPMPILGDALEEAGCDDADILSHCRGDGPHARGCWVVDMVLGKE